MPGTSSTFTLNSEPVHLGIAVAGADGSVALRATVPSNVVAGSHTVVIAGTDAAGAAVEVRLAVTVTSGVDIISATHGGLAQTGSSTALAGTFAFLLLLGGGLVFAAARRRTAQH